MKEINCQKKRNMESHTVKTHLGDHESRKSKKYQL